ncbi:MAG: VTT domain-containing protein [Patescibacteria group bacterium]|mgnify:CR=1 FL=1
MQLQIKERRVCYAGGMHWRGYIIITLIIVALAGLFFASPFLQDIFFIIAEDTSAYAAGHPFLAVAFFVFLAAISAMISPFSSVPIVPIAVLIWGWEITAGLLWSGWLAGGMLSYVIGRFAGNPILRQFIKPEKLYAHEERFSCRITFPGVLLLCLALPAEVGYAFGLIKYHFGKYIFATAIAEVPVAIVSVRAADALVSLDMTRFAEWVFLFTAIIGTAYFLFHKFRNAQ